jgi:hypothetical protein
MKTLHALASVWIAAAAAGCGSSDDSAAPAAGADGSPDTANDADAASTPSDGSRGDDGGPIGDATDVDSATPGGDAEAPDGDSGAADGSEAGAPPDASGAQCTGASGCKVFSNYCGVCACEALATAQAPPHCDGGMVTCFSDPCAGHTATCTAAGACALAP